MVFSWAIARSAGLTGTSEVEAVLSRAVRRKENGLGLTLETESEPSLRLWRCCAVARFLISNCRLPISDPESKSLDQFLVVHKGTQCLRNHDRAVGLLIILK